MGLRGSRKILHAPHGEEDGRDAGGDRAWQTRCFRHTGVVRAARPLQVRPDDAVAGPLPRKCGISFFVKFSGVHREELTLSGTGFSLWGSVSVTCPVTSSQA